MSKMVVTITVVPRKGTTERQLSQHLRASLESLRGTLVTELAVSTLPPDDAVPASV